MPFQEWLLGVLQARPLVLGCGWAHVERSPSHKAWYGTLHVDKVQVA
jgi:hypothetical protein